MQYDKQLLNDLISKLTGRTEVLRNKINAAASYINRGNNEMAEQLLSDFENECKATTREILEFHQNDDYLKSTNLKE